MSGAIGLLHRLQVVVLLSGQTFLGMTNPHPGCSLINTSAVNYLLDHIARRPTPTRCWSTARRYPPWRTSRRSRVLGAGARARSCRGGCCGSSACRSGTIGVLRLHPVLRFVEQDESVFADPFSAAVSSR